jgi:hypothetical protein
MMFGIYASPTHTFERLREKPVWLLPLLIAVVANMAATAVSAQFVDWQAQRDLALERMQQRGMPEEQIQKALEGMERFHTNPFLRTGLPLFGSLFNQLVAVFFLALVYNLCLPLLGAGGNYVRTLSVVTHAGLVALPGAVVRILLVLFKRSAEVSTSLLLAAPGLKPGFLYVLFSRVDLFVVWQLVLVGLGLKVAFGTKGSASYWLVFGIWFLLTLVFGTLALIGGGR